MVGSAMLLAACQQGDVASTLQAPTATRPATPTPTPPPTHARGYTDADFGVHRRVRAANGGSYAYADTKRAAGIDSFPAAHADTDAASVRIFNIYSDAHPGPCS